MTRSLASVPCTRTSWQSAELDAEPGGQFAVDIFGSSVRGEFLEVDPPHRVVVSWGYAGSEDLPPGASLVAFTLTPMKTYTRVELLHTNLPQRHSDVRKLRPFRPVVVHWSVNPRFLLSFSGGEARRCRARATVGPAT